MSKNLGRWMILVAATTLLVALLIAGQGLAQPAPIEQLGEFLYFDENLSEPAGQACASCHLPEAGFADPDKGLPVSEGVIPGVFGGRNSPSAAYAMYAPFFSPADEVGGQFWDGRATGEELGDPLADQALGPFVNDLEMNNPSRLTVVRDALNNGVYGDLFNNECGPVNLEDPESVDDAYECIALSIAAFERTALFGKFSSKYDVYLQACLVAGGTRADCATGTGLIAEAVGMESFTKKEWAGFQLFMGENNNDGVLDPDEGAFCVACHVADWIDPADYGSLNVVVPGWPGSGGMIPPMFTDFTYDNLGVPKSDHKLLRDNPTDFGLADGMFKVMTLRNIQLTKPYAHNGFFKNLQDITHFYNTRDVEAEGWPEAEVPGDSVNTDELGNLGLSVEDEKALVEFMKTLTDK